MEFLLKIKFKASAKDIFNTWLSAEGHSSMTGGKAEITNKVGDYFTAWDGYIEGKNLEILPFTRIAQSWRTSEFDTEDEDSILELTFEEHGGETEITLSHSNLPEHGEQYRQGWDDHYFQPMKTFFSS